MNITLYRNNSDTKVMDKVLSTIVQKEVEPYDTEDILHPSFILGSVDYEGVNYVYVSAFQRYYYAKSTLMENGLYMLECSVDPLMSWRSSIRNQPVIITKIEDDNVCNKLIPDGTFLTQANRFIQNIEFSSNQFSNNPSNILLVAGGT